MLAVTAALAAYRDGWSRVLRAPWLLVGLSAAAFALLLPGTWEEGELGYRTATVVADATMAIGGAADWALDIADLAYRDIDPTTQLLTLVALAVGAFLSGGILDRYARQRPVDARTFWGVSGELAARLLRLTAVVAVIALVLGTAGAALPVWAVPFELLVASVIFVVFDCARVRLVVERRRSVVFALLAGIRFASRHAPALLILYVLLVATLGAVLGLAALAASAADAARDAGAPIWIAGVRVIRAIALLPPTLLAGAALTSLFQAELAHATYVAPPRLVWPDSPAIESLGEPRDFPPSV
jgi:hypothetical protein